MKREWTTIFSENEQNGYLPGDDAAHRIAAALADRYDAPTIAAIADMLTLQDRIGGQTYVTAIRIQSSADPDWHISGLTFDYESRDAKIQYMPPPEEAVGIPITPSSAEPTRVELDEPASNGSEPEEEAELSEPVALTE